MKSDKQASGDPIVKRIQLNMRRALLNKVADHMRRAGVKETAAIHDLVVNGYRYGPAIEDWLAEETSRTGKGREYVIEAALWDLMERTEAERAANSARDQEKAAQLVQAAKGDVKPPVPAPRRK